MPGEGLEQRRGELEGVGCDAKGGGRDERIGGVPDFVQQGAEALEVDVGRKRGADRDRIFGRGWDVGPCSAALAGPGFDIESQPGIGNEPVQDGL